VQVRDHEVGVVRLHYVQIGAFVFPLFAAFYYWFPKVTGRMLSERMGRWNFWLFFIGVNVTFFPQHFLGLAGMTRRVYTYLPETGWGDMNMLSTIGAFTIATGALVFLGNVVWSLRNGERAGDNPWGAASLEWATHSPAPRYNFVHIPVVEGRYALWSRSAAAPVVTGMKDHKREVLVTSVLDAEPELRHEQPGPTLAPLAAAVAVGFTFIGLIFTPWALPLGLALALPALLAWGWPRPAKKLREQLEHEQAEHRIHDEDELQAELSAVLEKKHEEEVRKRHERLHEGHDGHGEGEGKR
ncbi:MAG TPA: cbb3-type cytochrome c oxidase subunit I, partial [Longimicrobiales bacterium]|nr:cbb3-type cytochrome c oxidase subunit I [Longimicrobiales bacterium]